MAVIRTVSTVTHYNMDISEDELLAVLASISSRSKVVKLHADPHAAELTTLRVTIQGALNHG